MEPLWKTVSAMTVLFASPVEAADAGGPRADAASNSLESVGEAFIVMSKSNECSENSSRSIGIVTGSTRRPLNTSTRSEGPVVLPRLAVLSTHY